MTNASEVSCRPRGKRTLWFFVGLGVAGAALVAVRLADTGTLLDAWAGIGLLAALMGIAALHWVTAQVHADAYGVHSRTLLRRRSVPWSDIADLRVVLKRSKSSRFQDARRVSLLLRDRHRRMLPLPRSMASRDPDFDATLRALRALHRRHGSPESSHVTVVSYRTAGRPWAGSLIVCALLLAGAGVVAWLVPGVASYDRAWRSAAPCTGATPAADRDNCLTTLRAVIARTEARQPKQRSRLYFADSRPLKQLEVSPEAAEGFQAGDSVELTVWRGEVREVTGEHYVWREHITTAGEPAVLAAVLALAAGFPGARLLLRVRGRRLPDDELLPSDLPFVGALVGTALWLLPLCHRHPTTLFTSPVAIVWAVAGSLVTAGLFTWAWRATRIRPPQAAASDEPGEDDGEVFLAARFLEHTDYNPHGFGTHIVLGGGRPAVTPHPGPGRFAAKDLPVERLTLRNVRRARGDDGDTVPGSWHIAELDDAGKPVRLAAAPADLTRIIRELDRQGLVRAPAQPSPQARPSR
ncbi:PH domain-containing protein [Streptomyces sp. NPDC001848]|uniref:PH domain-containing protein n=1 Tax=Streptomyces sp. NPDC001848 TaxID=3364618 RepID=UPI0036CDF8ED